MDYFYQDTSQIEEGIFKGRWIAIAVAVLLILLYPPDTSLFFVWGVILAAVLYNLAIGYLFLGRRYRLYLSYVTSFVDTIFISLYIFSCGYLTSEYATFYLLSIISVAIRFGFVETLSIGVVNCLEYGIVLFAYYDSFDFSSQFLTSCALILLAALLLGYFARYTRAWRRDKEHRERHLERKITELSVLQEVNRAVHDLQSDDTLRNLVEVATKVLGFGRAALFLVDGEGDDVEERFTSVRDTGALEQGRRLWATPHIHLDARLLAAILKKDRPLVVDGSQGSEMIGQEPEPLLVIPLKGIERPLGVLAVDYDDTHPLKETDLDMLMDLASSAIVAIENIQLHKRVQQLANRDGLTNLYNHRYFQESLRRELNQAKSAERPSSLVMVEVDRFKTYNDIYGHQRGDLALKSIARALEKSARRWGGLVARYGGDEFFVIMPGLHKEEALEAAQKIHKKIVTHTAEELRQYSLPRVAVSLGVATFPTDADEASALIDAADKAMYAAKRSGGDRVQQFKAPISLASDEVTT